jgi:DNA-binding protein HU-beta
VLDGSFTKGKQVNKTQLIEALSAHFDGNRRAAQHALESVVDTVTREVAKGNKVAITGFGAFERVTRPARMVRNPRTGERTRAKKTNVPKFRAGSDLKAVVSGAKKLPKVAASAAGRSTGTAKKTTAKKSPAKKTTSQSTAKKSPAKKTTAKKSPAKKSTAKKSTAKKSTAKKSAAKKSTAKRAPAKKSTAKKSTARKSTAKRTAKKS